MRDTEREARLEEIRERVEAHERGVKGAAHDDEASDLRFLLSEIDRLREIRDAASDVAETFGPKCWEDETVGRAGVYAGDAEDAETVRRLEAKLEGGDG